MFTTKPWPWVPHPQVFEHFPGKPVPIPDDYSFGKNFFLISSLKFPWCNLRPFPPHGVASFSGRSSWPLPVYKLLSDSCREWYNSPEPPFLQPKHPHLPPLLLKALVLQTLHQLSWLSLDLLQHQVWVFIMVDPTKPGGASVQWCSNYLA